MKKILSVGTCVACLNMAAMPQATGITVAQNKDTHEVTVSYTLTEAAIVTFSLETNGVALARSDYASARGDAICAGRKLEAGTHTMAWKPYEDWPNAGKDIPLEAKVKVWATNNPPEWIVANLAAENDVTYYESAADIPGGVTDAVYKNTKLVLRRIHAAGVPWEMGSPSNENGRDGGREALREVVLTNDFYIGIYELTQGQVAAITGSRPYSTYGGATLNNEWQPYPVGSYNSGALANLFSYEYLRGTNATEGISWPETGHRVGENSLLAKFRARTGLELDLPVEAQWEFAARGGCVTGLYDGHNITNTTFDANLDRLGWFYENSKNASGGRTTWPVGMKEPNAYGLYDMLGNLSEMCADWYNPAAGCDPNVGHAAPSIANCRNRRGGSAVWNYGCNTVRVNYRDATGASAGRADIGCRLAITLCY